VHRSGYLEAETFPLPPLGADLQVAQRLGMCGGFDTVGMVPAQAAESWACRVRCIAGTGLR